MLKKIQSLIFLGRFFILHLFKRVFFVLKKDSSATFLNHYAGDHIFALSQDDKKLLMTASACYACKLCDNVCPKANDAQHNLPSFVILSQSRLLTDLHRSPNDCPDGCHQCDLACPVQIPIRSLIDWIKDHQNIASISSQ